MPFINQTAIILMPFIYRLNTVEESQTISIEKLKRVNDYFSCLVYWSEDQYKSSNPLQDKCYSMARSIDRLVQLIQCSFCIKQKVCELNSENGITKKHYDVSSSYIT